VLYEINLIYDKNVSQKQKAEVKII